MLSSKCFLDFVNVSIDSFVQDIIWQDLKNLLQKPFDATVTSCFHRCFCIKGRKIVSFNFS